MKATAPGTNAQQHGHARARNLVREAQAAIGEVLSAGDLALDATVGSGRDTLFLARAVGPSGRVWGFDCQPQALQQARVRLRAAGLSQRVELRCAGHEQIDSLLPSSVRGRLRAAMFNLGYLPGGNRQITTRAASTLQALDAVSGLLAPHGRISVVAYTGHPGGREEAAAVRTWADSLRGEDYTVRTVHSDSARHDAPQWFLVTIRGQANTGYLRTATRR